MRMQEQNRAEAPVRGTYETPTLVRYGGIEELTQGVNALTTNVTDVLSIRS
jgi:hypothetical protein